MTTKGILTLLILVMITTRIDCEPDQVKIIIKNENSTGRTVRGVVSDRERRLIPYMMFYIGQPVPNSRTPGNIIPLSIVNKNIERYSSSVPQLTTNSLQQQQPTPAAPSPVQYNTVQLLPASVFNKLQAAGLIQVQPQQSPATHYQSQSLQQYETSTQEEHQPQTPAPSLGQIYSFRSPGPQPSQQLTTEQQQYLDYHKQIKPIKYKTPQLIKVIQHEYDEDASARPDKSYVQIPKPYNYYTYKTLYPSQLKTEQGGLSLYAKPDPTEEPKLYQIQLPLRQYSRLRVLRPVDKIKYPPSKLYRASTTESPYVNKVKFELEDARLPHLQKQHVLKYEDFKLLANPIKYHHSTPPQYYIGPQVSELPEDVQVLEQPTATTATTTTTPGLVTEQGNTLEPDNHIENVLTVLKQTNKLPDVFTPENIDGSIRTLALILEKLQHSGKKPLRVPVHPNYNKIRVKPIPVPVPSLAPVDGEAYRNGVKSFPESSGTSTPGRAGIDYPTYSVIPSTSFDCSTQRYKGFFGDPDTQCQVWHYCDLNGGQASFLCPNGTIFSQVALTCDWWFNVKCASTTQLYVLNERLYKYILPFSPSFPEDYSGPLVDRYLAARFKEMEAKTRLKALKQAATSTTTEPSIETETTVDTEENTLTNTEIL